MSGWKHNDTFRLQNSHSFEFYIQDEYKLMVKQKWSKVKHVLETAATTTTVSPSTWFLNYCSAQNWPIQPPRYIAWWMNKSLSDHIDSVKNGTQPVWPRLWRLLLLYGRIVLDFATEQLIKNIYLLNLKNLNHNFFLNNDNNAFV